MPTEPEEVTALIDSPKAFEEAGVKVKEKTGNHLLIVLMHSDLLDGAETTFLNPKGELLMRGRKRR